MNSTVSEPKISFEDTSIAFLSKTNKELGKIYFLFLMMNQPFLVKIGTGFLKLAFQWRIPFVKSIVKKTIFSHFCGGESIEDCEKSIQNLDKYRIGTILDYSVEGEKTEIGFENTCREIIQTIERSAMNKSSMPFAVFKVTGIASTPLLEKIQANQELSEEEKTAWGKVQNRVDLLCEKAHQHKIKILIDGEETWIQKTIDELAYLMMEKYNREEVIVYNTYQMYLRASYSNLQNAMTEAEDKNYFLGAKLVRGAYMEKERKRAKENGYADPIQPDKNTSDADFDKGILFCIKNKDRIGLCAGTHNEKSNHYLTELMYTYQLAPNDQKVFFAQLYGMSDHISYNLANAGYNVAKYVPYGAVESVMPYLFRRAEENTSVAGQSSREFLLVKNERRRRRKQK